MLQTIQTVHNFSVLNPSLYFGSLLVLLLVVLRGWYCLGSLNALALVSPAPMLRLRSPRFVFYRRGYAVVLTLANLLILASIELNNDTIVATIAVRVT